MLEAAALRGAPQVAFGRGETWREPLWQLLKSLREEAGLSPLGLTMAHGQIVMMLRARIRAVALWEAHPEMLDRPVAGPVVILGQMRSGTTRLHRLLACDPRFAYTRMSEAMIPAPFARRPGARDSRRLRARAGLMMVGRLNPELGRIHPTAPGAAEEEFGWLSFGFGAAQFEAQWRAPGFTRWWEGADKSALYREFGALLRTNAWFRGVPPGRPWLLKAPQFMEDLPALLAAFPDARLICLERDLGEVVPSSASLVWNQMRIQSDSVDPAWIGREWLRRTRRRAEIAAATRHARPDVPAFEVGYEAMNADWRGEIARIYDFLGLPLAAEMLARMQVYVDRARAHVGHNYSLAQFGLDAANVAPA
ncbi:MAG: sulfotransferase family protein [Allosphingosinicella sp.]